MKNLLSRTFSTGGGSLIRVRNEKGEIDLMAILATAIRLALLAGALYLANELGVYEQLKTIINGS